MHVYACLCVCIAVWTGMALGDKEAVVQLMEEWKNPHRAGNKDQRIPPLRPSQALGAADSAFALTLHRPYLWCCAHLCQLSPLLFLHPFRLLLGCPQKLLPTCLDSCLPLPLCPLSVLGMVAKRKHSWSG